MKLNNIKHKKGWFRLCLIFSPITGYIIGNYFNRNFNWHYDINSYYIPLEVILGFIMGVILHFFIFIIFLYMIDWIIEGFRKDQ